MILHAHVRLADDWIALRVSARRVVARIVRHRNALMTLHVLVNAAEHDVFEDEASSPASLMVPGAHDAH